MKRYFNVTLALLFAILYSNTAYASSVSARAGWVVESGYFVGHEPDPITGTGVNVAQIQASYQGGEVGSVAAVTSLGRASGSGNITRRGIIKIANRFSLDNLVLSYNGSGLVSNVVGGDVHLTYSASVGVESAPGILRLGLDLGAGTGFRNTSFDVETPIGGVISETRNFTLGQIFTLQFIGEMVIPSRLVESAGGRYSGSGGYSMFLGGSPVFNLPDGYVINSADGSIVNNYYTGLGAPSAVPIPAAIWLMASGLIGLLGVRRKK